MIFRMKKIAASEPFDKSFMGIVNQQSLGEGAPAR